MVATCSLCGDELEEGEDHDLDVRITSEGLTLVICELCGDED